MLTGPSKSPWMAAVGSFIIPGLGHLYAAAVLRGVLVFFAASYLPFLAGPRPWLYGVLMLAGHSLAAYDAWRCAHATNAREEVARLNPRRPSRFILWRWAFGRSLWSVLLAGWFGYSVLSLLWSAPEEATLMGTLVVLFFSGICFVIGGLGTRETWRVLCGAETRTEGALRSEADLTAVVIIGLGLMLAIVWPAYSDLFRKSAEGAAKSRLGQLRTAVTEFKSAHGGAAPATFEDLVADGRLEKIPRLWSKDAGVPHPIKTGIRVVSERVSNDSGGWAYAPDGTVFIDCTHTDTKGAVWSAY